MKILLLALSVWMLSATSSAQATTLSLRTGSYSFLSAYDAATNVNTITTGPDVLNLYPELGQYLEVAFTLDDFDLSHFDGELNSSHILEWNFKSGDIVLNASNSTQAHPFSFVFMDGKLAAWSLEVNTPILFDRDFFILSTNTSSAHVSAYYGASGNEISKDYTRSSPALETIDTPNFRPAWVVQTTTSPVPESSTFAMMIAGLGLIGISRRRKMIK